MRAVVIGAVESSRIAIEAITQANAWSLPLVVSLPADLADRHSDYVDLRPAAQAAGAEMLFASAINKQEICEAIKFAAPDYTFVIGWSQICGDRVIAAAGRGMIGYHPSPLPRMRGRAVIPWTILANEPITGGTLFWIDAGVDSGPILEQRFLHVAPDETAGSLYLRHMDALSVMMASALASLATGTARRDEQDERFATWAARRTPESGRIDWTLPAPDVERLVRASGRPYPGARTVQVTTGEALTIWAARVSPDGGRHLARPGQVVARSASRITVQCGHQTAIEILEWESSVDGFPKLHVELGDCR